ncbi:GatB/GatE catalytic domain-containing protein [Hyaloraphidium curvatum]|nr:GatB/GatE catalytic domain-containing protein [Hyaloraphidium curvatum]
MSPWRAIGVVSDAETRRSARGGCAARGRQHGSSASRMAPPHVAGASAAGAAFASVELLALVASALGRRFPGRDAPAGTGTARRHSSTAPNGLPRPTYKSPTTGKEYRAVIGLEIHAQLNAQTKLFSDAVAAVEGPPNNNVTVFDAAIPGSLPRLNSKCVREGLRTALVLNANVNRQSSFDRKHYFYQDIPLGYQITQKNSPLASGGHLTLNPPYDGLPYSLSVPLVQLQIEQDTARSYTISSPSFSHFRHYALVGIDLNRAGVGLMEIVTEPVLRSGAEAAAFVRKLVKVVEHIGSVRPGGMEGGVMRVDVNVSVVPLSADGDGDSVPTSGVRVEVKNLNSVRSVSRAVDHEVARHISLLEAENSPGIQRETRHWDEIREVTVANRSKELNEDYRYMPDGDLPILRVSEGALHALRKTIPMLPDQVRADLVARHGPNGLAAEAATMLLNEPGAVPYFEELVEKVYERRRAKGNSDLDVRDCANWTTQTLYGVLHAQARTMVEATAQGMGPAVLAELIHMTETGVVSQLSAKYILSDIAAGDQRSPSQLALDRAYLQNSSEDSLLPLVESFVAQHADRAERVRQGKDGLIGWFIGEIRKKSGWRADPIVLRKLVEKTIWGNQGKEGHGSAEDGEKK